MGMRSELVSSSSKSVSCQKEKKREIQGVWILSGSTAATAKKSCQRKQASQHCVAIKVQSIIAPSEWWCDKTKKQGKKDVQDESSSMRVCFTSTPKTHCLTLSNSAINIEDRIKARPLMGKGRESLSSPQTLTTHSFSTKSFKE